ncbi:MAG: DEAD/DEAH box helicase family protein, partial [Chloroflexi bacterium]|nr:DEAD/DEAH box helicase family protein [Chloroflexota bacterium]
MIDNPAHDLHFKWTWRPYQDRVLDMIDQHISDRKLHVVAAPGSGKTTLGIEVFRRLGAPALVLSPTRTIRDQWVSRLKDFLPDGSSQPDWVSTHLDELKFFNSITYQALHTRYRETMSLEEEIDDLDNVITNQEMTDFVEKLRAARIGTLILDEAHHLRVEWWKALTAVIDQLDEIHLVALTATPPYDVVGSEWYRYQELCGPIDEEISVPESVKVGTLCPHQDFVYAIEPLEDGKSFVRQYEQNRQRLFAELLQDPVMITAVRTHPFVVNPAPDEVLANPELAFSLLSYLKTRGETLPKQLQKLMAVSNEDVPPMNKRWWQILVRAYLYDNNWPVDASHREELMKTLRARGLLWRRELYLDNSRQVKNQLSTSAAKVQACVNIYQMERKVRGKDLRMVILTDYIRDEALGDANAILQLGAFPIFRALTRWIPPHEAERVALLTGRASIVHRNRLANLRQIMPDVSWETLGGLPDYVRITSSRLNELTEAFTQMLGDGQIQVLVGTRALLGEGWDAPVVNSLILASFVGSFMLTNQMRGRAIRVDINRPDKASSIWHIVAMDPTSQSGLEDFADLDRRFHTFVGLGASEPIIESGLRRLELPRLWSGNAIERNNQTMGKRLENIDSLHQRWAEATGAGVEGRVIPSIESSGLPQIRAFHLTRTLLALIMETLMIVGFIVSYSLQGTVTGSVSSFLTVLFIALGIALIVTLPRFIRIMYMGIRHLPVDGSVRQIGLAVRDALCEADLLRTECRRLKVLAQKLDDGSFGVTLTGGTYYEEALFADSLVGPVPGRGLEIWVVMEHVREVGRVVAAVELDHGR